jgi:hypothetical protein
MDPAAHQPAQRCGATNRQGKPCGKAAGWGTDHVGTGHCKLHGGASPNGRKHAQREQATQAVATYGLPRDIDPQAALLEELHRTAGHVAWLQLKVAELDEHQTYGPVGGSEHGYPSTEAHIWIRLYQQERKHFTDVAKTCIACGIAERQIQLAEQQGQLLARALDGILTDLGVRNHPEAPAVVRRHLTLLDGGQQAA